MFLEISAFATKRKKVLKVNRIHSTFPLLIKPYLCASLSAFTAPPSIFTAHVLVYWTSCSCDKLTPTRSNIQIETYSRDIVQETPKSQGLTTECRTSVTRHYISTEPWELGRKMRTPPAIQARRVSGFAHEGWVFHIGSQLCITGYIVSHTACMGHYTRGSSWHTAPRMKRRSEIHQKIVWSVVQQPQSTNSTTIRGLERTIEWDLSDGFSEIENGVFSVWEHVSKRA